MSTKVTLENNPTVKIELSVEDAGILLALLGATSGDELQDLYELLSSEKEVYALKQLYDINTIFINRSAE